MRFIIVLGFAALGLFGSRLRADDPKNEGKADAARLVGTYRLAGGERGGQKIAEDRLNAVKVQIAANAITTFDKDKKQVYAATYELDTSRKPWRITMTATLTPAEGKGTRAEGLVEMDGDEVKLIYALPGGKAPTEFKTGDKQQMFVLKKTDK